MLESLNVKNFVLISELNLDLSNGFACITGETGSGKSIILGAISLILGEKGEKELVREGAVQAEISAVFSVDDNAELTQFLKDNDIEAEDGEVIVRRVIKNNGRNVITIGGVNVSRSILSSFGALCVEVSSQHAHQNLLKEAEQLKIVDRASLLEEELKDFKESYNLYKSAETELEEFLLLSARSKEEEDYLRFCTEEIEKANIKLGEDEELRNELNKIASSEVLCDNIEQSLGLLEGTDRDGILSELSKVKYFISKAEGKDENLSEYRERLDSCLIELEDISSSLQDYLHTLSFSPEELEEKNSRMSQLQRLKKKYGSTLDLVQAKFEEMMVKLNSIDNAEEKADELKAEVERLREIVNKKGQELTKKRIKSSKRLEAEIEANLKALGMEKAHFLIEREECPLSSNGFDRIQFKIAANKGEKTGLISTVASGGELSRIMLAIKVALSEYDNKATLIFDEVDAGIGGNVANQVGDMLKRLSSTHQVLAITHLAQIAAKCDTHFVVNKKEEKGRTISRIVEVKEEERVKEIARLLSGDASDISLTHARLLLEV